MVLTWCCRVPPGVLAVSARSHFYDRDDGGVWVSRDADHAVWTRTFNKPVFNLLDTKVGTPLWPSPDLGPPM